MAANWCVLCNGAGWRWVWRSWLPKPIKPLRTTTMGTEARFATSTT